MKETYEKYVGKEARILLGDLEVNVVIEDVKTSYGRERYLVSPIAGEGKVWVETVTLK